jgi:hypothetical protein
MRYLSTDLGLPLNILVGIFHSIRSFLNMDKAFIFAFISLIIIALWLLSSAIILTYAAFRDRIEDDRILGIKKYTSMSIIMTGGYMGYFAIFFFLIMEGLFFIPETWGNFDQDDEWVSARHVIAGIIAFIITLELFGNYKEVIKYLKEKIKDIFSKNWGNKTN